MNRNRVTRAALGVLLLSFAILLAACTRGAAAAPLATAAPAATAAPSATPVASPADVKVGDADNGRTVTVPAGSTVTLVLTSTYWQVQGSSDAAVLALASGPAASGVPMSAPGAAGGCVPGGGCGSITSVFHAVAAGRASITASRTTCGEAMQCTGSAGAYQVTIIVTK